MLKKGVVDDELGIGAVQAHPLGLKVGQFLADPVQILNPLSPENIHLPLILPRAHEQTGAGIQGKASLEITKRTDRDTTFGNQSKVGC